MIQLNKRKKEYLYSLLFILPALILFLSVVYYPLIQSLFYSMTDWDGMSKNYNIIGINNFIEMLKDDEIVKSFTNTIYYAIVITVFSTIIQMVIAVSLHEQIKGSNTLKVIIYLPCIISTVIVSIAWTHILQSIGLLNKVLEAVQLQTLYRDWLSDVNIVKNTISFVHMWQWTGFGTIIYLTGLNSIPGEINEAVNIDGASGLRKFFHITLPLIMPAITINIFMAITGTLKLFDAPFTMTGGGPMNASTTVTMTIYDTAFSYQRFGLASAAGVMFFIFIAAISIAQLWHTRKMEVEH